MKTYTQLSPLEKQRAHDKAKESIFEAINETDYGFWQQVWGTAFADQVRRASEKAEEMRTPWFWLNYVGDYLGDLIHQLAVDDAERAVYAEPSDPPVVTGVIN